MFYEFFFSTTITVFKFPSLYISVIFITVMLWNNCFGSKFKGQSQCNISFFYFMLFTFCTFKDYTELHYSIAEGIVFFIVVHRFQQPSSTFEQDHVFPQSKSCCLSSAATGTQHSVGSYQQNGVITGFFSKHQAGDNVIV